MSNSDNTSNSDDKLEALYKLTQQPDSDGELSADSSAEDVSPPDIDATILAAAREATTSELATPIEEIEETAGKTSILSWQRRFGWATAATVLLTSVLFISLIDNDPKLGTLSSEKAELANDAPIVQQSRYEADTDAAKESIGAARDAYAVEQELDIELISDRGVTLVPALQSVPQSTPPATPPNPEAIPEAGDIAAFSKRLREPESLQDKPSPVIEEIVVTSRPIARKTENARLQSAPAESAQAETAHAQYKRSDCRSYPKLLISQVCRNTSELSTSTSLRANQQSECIGQELTLSAGSELPTPHNSSTLDRFVLQSEDAASPTEEVVCQSGKLVRQSLARGR